MCVQCCMCMYEKKTPKRIVSPCQKDIQSKSLVHLIHIPHTLQLCYYLPDIRKYRAYSCMWPSKYLENGDERISRLVCLCEMKTLTWGTEIEKKEKKKRSERGSIHCLQTKFTVHVCQKTGENTFFFLFRRRKKKTQLWIEIRSNFFLFIINIESRTIYFQGENNSNIKTSE